MSRREQDRRGPQDRDDSRRHPAAAGRPRLNEYWIDGNGINRQVLQTEICKYLGAEATCRPGDYQGVAGFKIKALRPFTPDMLDDLRTASKNFMSENRAYMRRHDRGNNPQISPSPVPEPLSKIGGIWLTPPPELAYNDSRTYEQANGDGMDFDRPAPGPGPGPGRDSPAYTSGPGAYAHPASSAPGYPNSSAVFSGASAFATHPGLPSNGQGAPGYSQDHSSYTHPPPSRDVRDPRDAMRDTPGFSNGYADHNSNYHGLGPPYGDPYAAQRGGDQRDPRMAYDNYNSISYAPPRRQEPPHFDPVQGMSGPGNGYGPPPPSRNNISGYNEPGYDQYSRVAPVDPRYGRR